MQFTSCWVQTEDLEFEASVGHTARQTPKISKTKTHNYKIKKANTNKTVAFAEFICCRMYIVKILKPG